jgi:hypothetical protein
MKYSNAFDMCEAVRLKSGTGNELMFLMLAKSRTVLEIYLLDIIISVKFRPTNLDR